MRDPETEQFFQQIFGFSLSEECKHVLPIAERIISLKVGELASKTAHYQAELAEITEKAKTELSPEKCLVLYNQATDVVMNIRRAEREFQEAVRVANVVGGFQLSTDYDTYPILVKNPREEEKETHPEAPCIPYSLLKPAQY